ncbi:MAG: erythromycin esterase family protein [Polyangiaceae bacterium]
MPALRSLRRSLSPTLVAATLALSAAALTGSASADPPVSPPGFGGYPVGPGLYHLSGTDPDLPSDDLAPLKVILGNATYVGLGESFHTSGGFYELKHRVFRYLVQDMGFRVLAMETPWLTAESVSHYVETCEGTPRDALNGVFSVFRSEETAALVQWMCEWNAAHPTDRVHFYGFDVQREAKPNAQALIAYLDTLGVPAGHPWIDGIRSCDGVVDSFYPFQQFPAARYEECQSALSAVEAYFDAEEPAIRNATSRDALAEARIHLRAEQGVQELEYKAPGNIFDAVAARDLVMAYMVEAIHDLQFPHARTAVWAHNGHVIDNSTDALDYISTGTHLSESLGDKYRIVGLGAHVTQVNWPAVGLCGPVDFETDGLVEDALHDLGLGDLIVDMSPRGSFTSFIDPEVEYSIGGFYYSSLPGNMDALLYLEESPKMASFAWPVCGE